MKSVKVQHIACFDNNLRCMDFFRSVASWFDEDGVLHFDTFLEDISEMYKALKKEKSQ